MERTRPAHLAQDSGFETIGSLPGSATLPELLEAVRSPGVLRAEVDALFGRLCSPLDESESPRAHADLLLSVIESSDVGDLSGSHGVSLRAAAVKGLLDLGYPYALEVPPEAIGLAREAERATGETQVPTVGLTILAIGVLIQLVFALPGVANYLSRDTPSVGAALLWLTLLLGPACAAVFGGWQRVRWLQRLGVVTVIITGCLWMLGFLLALANYGQPFSRPETWAILVAGVSFVLGALLTRRPEWLPPGKKPEGEPPAR